jgi:hypothetical protein
VPDPPERISDEELRRLNTITALHASSAVQEATRSMSGVLRRFQAAAFVLDAERKAAARPAEILQHWEAVEAEREVFSVALETLRSLAADELSQDEPRSPAD